MLGLKIRTKYHLVICEIYLLLLHDKDKVKHPKRYAFANKRWRYHAIKTSSLLGEQLERLSR